MTTWKWPQPDGKVWRAEVNYKEGIIEIFDENDKLMMKKENLSMAILILIENSFFKRVATRERTSLIENPMYQ